MRNASTETAPEPYVAPPVEDDGIGAGEVAAGAVGLGGAAWLASKLPGRWGKALGGLNALRQQLMLSGMALPKSMLGNVGAAATASIERGSMAPLKELFSKQTVSDAVKAFKAHGSAGPTPGVTLPGPVPGRFMGAADEATRGALQRAGLSSTEATREVLQSPLTGVLGEAMEGPVATYLHPFRRTPFNQFLEGLKAFEAARSGAPGARRTMAVYGGAGAAHGAATADEQYPVTVPLGIATAGRYGLPYTVAALLGRKMAGGKGGGGMPGAALPVSEYGFEQSISDPLRPFRQPAAFTALDKLTR